MVKSGPLYRPGQLVRHKRYGYRGVIAAVDSKCLAPEEWYQRNKTQPKKDQPWYHVLVDASNQVTYPAESSLIPDETCEEVDNPLIEQFFEGFEGGSYIRNSRPWPEL